MDSGPEWPRKLGENLLLEEELKDVQLSQLNFSMIKLESLKKNNQFKLALKEKKTHTDFFSIFAAKNFIPSKNKNLLHISFVMKKKIGNAVKRNKIRRKLKAIVHKLLKIKGAINSNYTYIVFGKTKSFSEKHEKLFDAMTKSFKKLDNK